MDKKKEKLSDEQKRHFRLLFRLALHGHDGTCHDLCTFENAAAQGHLRAALSHLPAEGEIDDPAMEGGVNMCKELGIPLTTKNSAEEDIMFFISGRCFACYSYLISQNMKPVVKNTWGVTALNQACQLLIETGDARILQHLIVNKHYPVDLGDDSDQTLLHQAAKCNSPPAIFFLLEMGANINHRDAQHKTALFIACQKACFRAAETLIKSGAKYTGVYQMNERKETLLHAGARSSVASKKLLKMLIWLNIPLQMDNCGCKPSKKQFCNKISPHIKEYLNEKFAEFNEKKKPKKEPSSPNPFKRLMSRSSSGASKSKSQLTIPSSSSSSLLPQKSQRSETGSSSAEKFNIICLGDTMESLGERARSATASDLTSV